MAGTWTEGRGLTGTGLMERGRTFPDDHWNGSQAGHIVRNSAGGKKEDCRLWEKLYCWPNNGEL